MKNMATTEQKVNRKFPSGVNKTGVGLRQGRANVLPFKQRKKQLPGLAGELVAWGTAAARRIDAETMVTAGVLAGLSALTAGRFVGDFKDGATPACLFLSVVAPTGSGKEDAQTVARAIFDTAHQEGGIEVGYENMRSDAAMHGAFLRCPRQLFFEDESGLKAQAAQSGVAPYQAGLNTMMMELWGRPSLATRSYADSGKDKPAVPAAFLTVLRTTTAASLTPALSSEQIDNGSINRYIYLFAEKTAKKDYDQVKQVPMPPRLVQAIKKLSSPASERKAIALRLTSGTHALAARKLRYFDEKEQTADASALWARTYEQGKRLATIFAVARAVMRPGKPCWTMEAEDLQAAFTFAEQTTEKLIAFAKNEIHDSRDGRIMTKIEAHLRKIPARSDRSLRSKVAKAITDNLSVPYGEATRVINLMLQNGAIRAEKKERGKGDYLVLAR